METEAKNVLKAEEQEKIKWFIVDWKGFSEEREPEWNIKKGSKFTNIKGWKVRLSLLIRKKNTPKL